MVTEEIDLADLTTEDLNRITRSVKKAKVGRPYKCPGMKLEIYLKPEWADHLDACIEYAYQNHMIKSPTKYAFGGWAVERIIMGILEEKMRSKQNSDLQNSLT